MPYERDMCLVLQCPFVDPFNPAAVFQHFFDEGVDAVPDKKLSGGRAGIACGKALAAEGGGESPFYDKQAGVAGEDDLADGFDADLEFAGAFGYGYMFECHLLADISPFTEIGLQEVEQVLLGKSKAILMNIDADIRIVAADTGKVFGDWRSGQDEYGEGMTVEDGAQPFVHMVKKLINRFLFVHTGFVAGFSSVSFVTGTLFHLSEFVVFDELKAVVVAQVHFRLMAAEEQNIVLYVAGMGDAQFADTEAAVDQNLLFEYLVEI
jgi:hypothetical protein